MGRLATYLTCVAPVALGQEEDGQEKRPCYHTYVHEDKGTFYVPPSSVAYVRIYGNKKILIRTLDGSEFREGNGWEYVGILCPIPGIVHRVRPFKF